MKHKQLTDTPYGTPIWGRTKAHIQAKITASTTPGERFILMGEYDFSANPDVPLIINKNVELFGTNNCTFNGADKTGYLVKINNISQGLALRNVKFTSTATTASNAMVYVNEEGDVNNLTLDNCDFTGPNGNFNGFGMNAYAGNTGTAARFNNITLFNCVAHDLGRMGYECLSHKWDGDPRITNFFFINCRAERTGLFITTEKDTHGMGISLSGNVMGVTMTSPVMLSTSLGIELIGTRRVAITNPRIISSRVVTSTDGVKLYSSGFSLTDGGNRGQPPSDITISGGYVNVSGRSINSYYGTNTTFNGGQHVSGQYLQFQNGTGNKIHGLDVECTGEKFIVSFENQKDLLLEGGVWSRQNAPRNDPSTNSQWPMYQPISLDGSCTGCTVRGVSVKTNTAINGGDPDNYYDGQPWRLRYVYDGGTGNSVYDIWLNGVKQIDGNAELIPTQTITSGTSGTLLTHIRRVVFNPSTTLASYALTLPPGTVDGQVLKLYGNGTANRALVTSFSVAAPSGQTLAPMAVPAAFNAGMVLTFEYMQSASRWYLQAVTSTSSS